MSIRSLWSATGRTSVRANSRAGAATAGSVRYLQNSALATVGLQGGEDLLVDFVEVHRWLAGDGQVVGVKPGLVHVRQSLADGGAEPQVLQVGAPVQQGTQGEPGAG